VFSFTKKIVFRLLAVPGKEISIQLSPPSVVLIRWFPYPQANPVVAEGNDAENKSKPLPLVCRTHWAFAADDKKTTVKITNNVFIIVLFKKDSLQSI